MREKRTAGAEQFADMSGEGTDREGLNKPERRDRTHPPTCTNTAARQHRRVKVNYSAAADDAEGHQVEASGEGLRIRRIAARVLSRAGVDT